MPPAARGGLLKGHVFLRLRVVADRFTIEDQRAVLELLRRADELREHEAVVLEVARENTHLGAVLVDLHPHAVVLRLDRDGTELLDDGFGTRQPLGQLRSQGPSDGDLQGRDALLAVGPERPGDEAQV